MPEQTWLDPLGEYLGPRFESSLREAEWTPGLTAAVKEYLKTTVTRTDYQVLLNELYDRPPKGSRAEQATFIIQHHSPYDLRQSFHFVAVETRPSLDDIIGGLASWRDLEDPLDAAYWLYLNATDEQLRAVAKVSPNAALRAAAARYVPEAEVVIQTLNPQELLTAWHKVADPTDTDLTDEEWALLTPLLHGHGRRVRRSSIDGILYRHYHGTSWAGIPGRYGNSGSMMVLYSTYRRNGTFAQLLGALDGNPEAARLVAWLQRVAKPRQ